MLMDKDIKAFQNGRVKDIKEFWNFEPDAKTYTIYTNEANGKMVARKYAQIENGEVVQL